jgi:hypothetical protein
LTKLVGDEIGENPHILGSLFTRSFCEAIVDTERYSIRIFTFRFHKLMVAGHGNELSLKLNLVRFVCLGQAHGHTCSDIASATFTANGNSFGVDAEVFCILDHPLGSGITIVNSLRSLGFRSESVANINDNHFTHDGVSRD